ncbi:MAG: ComEA family DNA-binding protein [Candidatus Dojkabacteria bacterium]|nr:ComEA family DNA-binding protein [Candidatus Dojkabacteria bacterium]
MFKDKVFFIRDRIFKFFSQNKENIVFYLNLIVVFLIIVLGIFIFVKYHKQIENAIFTNSDTNSINQNTIKIENTLYIVIDINGAVNKPGVYTLKSGDRIIDAINIAGGLHEEVDLVYVAQKINRAQKLVDGQKIYIPFRFENNTSVTQVEDNANIQTNTSKISINNATQEELERLNGVGPVTAQKIIENRPYVTLDELVKKNVISENLFNKIVDEIEP